MTSMLDMSVEDAILALLSGIFLTLPDTSVFPF